VLLFTAFALLCYIIVANGKPGSILAAFLAPDRLVDITTGTTPTRGGQDFTNTSSVKQMILNTFGTYGEQALRIAQCESGLNAVAVNPSSMATGVFQFLPSTWATTSYAKQDPKDAKANIAAAYEVFKRDGFSWREWECSRVLR
jgi:Transglycosylase-like domain